MGRPDGLVRAFVRLGVMERKRVERKCSSSRGRPSRRGKATGNDRTQSDAHSSVIVEYLDIDSTSCND